MATTIDDFLDGMYFRVDITYLIKLFKIIP